MIDEYLGRYATKRLGFFSGLIGVIERSSSGIVPYRLTFKSGGSVGFSRLEDIILLDDDEMIK